ncbi:MAG: dTDP-4-amino-4,6-dideoxygalactose transaminase [Chthoniobacterales bacterium]|nr:dTDP-4-amino-4,6-dideoxygalactose transaminase [Chthoniobacterales bacterium]
MIRIPFNRPFATGAELEHIRAVMATPKFSGDGSFTARCHSLLEHSLNVQKALLTTSCTHALEMAALLLNLKAGDDVLVPSFNFPSAANAFVLRGARPVFADIRADTLNIDENRIEQRLTDRTKAIFLVHYAGVGCEMDTIMAIARRRGLAVVEDNAHGLFGKYRGRFLGTIGQLATLSFHETKNFTCGEGGALLINDERFNQRAEILREKGTDRARFFRGEIDKYTWVDVGSSYLPSDVLAAFLLAQLECRERIQSMRRHIWETYANELASWAEANRVRLPIVPAECEQAYHMFYMIMPTQESRRALISHLAGYGILAVFHYLPLHLSPMGLRFGGRQGDCPVAEDLADRLLRLPFYTGMNSSEQSQVIEAVRAFRCQV